MEEPTQLEPAEAAMRARLRAALFDASAAPRTFGRYVVQAALGRGGLGIVYLAHDPELHRSVAIKLVAGEIGRIPKVRERLRREAQALARLSHPNVVAVHDVGTEGGETFLAMELIDGRTLSEWASERERSWREILDVLVGAARGLAAAHRVELVHRDVKPANVLVDREGRARVLDFGLARAIADGSEASGDPPPSLASELTDADTLLGTPAYMAPEQFLRQSVDARADQWGLCVTAYELLYRRRPFVADNLEALRKQVLAGVDPTPPRGSDVPAWLHRVILRGLATDPDDRFSDMDALVRELVRDRSRARRVATAAVALVAVAAGIAGLAAWMGKPEPSTCTGHVVVSGFHGQWSTPNAIRWAWTVEQGDVDALHEYRVIIGPTREDVETRSSATRTYTPADNPELAFLRLPGTLGLDAVEGTITDELAVATEYAGQLVAVDDLGCQAYSDIALERTAPAPGHTIAVFDEELAVDTFPVALVPVRDRARAFAGETHLEYRSVDDPECPGPDVMCYQNLRIFDLDVAMPLREAYGKTAYLEFALRAKTSATPYWSNIMVEYGDGWASFDGWTVRPDASWRVVQVPLRALRRGDDDPPSQEEVVMGMHGFGIGGAWGHGAEIDLDRVLVRY